MAIRNSIISFLFSYFPLFSIFSVSLFLLSYYYFLRLPYFYFRLSPSSFFFPFLIIALLLLYFLLLFILHVVPLLHPFLTQSNKILTYHFIRMLTMDGLFHQDMQSFHLFLMSVRKLCLASHATSSTKEMLPSTHHFLALHRFPCTSMGISIK